MDSLTDLDLDEIDDTEFAIPAIDGPLPTLESILNEEDNDSDVSELELDQNIANNGIDSTLNEYLDSIENSSISSLDSRSLKKSSNIFLNDSKTNGDSIEGSVIKHSILKSLSAQLKSANTDRINAGKPTALTVSSAYIAVGTSHGFVLVFDLRQVMKSCLRLTEDSGSVSAMTIRKDNLRLLCGYSRGDVSLWNLQSGELIKLFNELHSPQTTVLHLKYLSDNNFGALSDSSGSVFLLDFRRKDVDSQCIFSGSRGEVLAIEPLLVSMPSNKEVIHFNSICLLSMATVTKVIAITVRPSVTVHFTQILKGNFDTLPLLCWQFVMVQISEDNRVIDPVLSFARQNNIYFFQASYKSTSKVLFTPLMQISVGYIIQSIIWLNSRTMVTIDGSEKMHVLDVRSEEEIEVIETHKIQMVYASALFKSIENGTNVSPAMSASAKRACYHSVCVSNTTLSNNSSSNLLILGISSVHLFTIRSWTERIELLINENRFVEALGLTLSFYNNSAKAVIGLNGKKSEKRKIVSQKLIEVLNKYVDYGISLCPENGKIEYLFEHYRHLIPTCVDYCLAIEDNHYILNELYDKFSDDSIAKNIFLDALEPHVLKGDLKNFSPILAKELIRYYEDKKWFHNLEAVVTHIEITSLDIHYVMTICQKHCLFDAIIYIHNNAFDDYMTPFDQLIQKLEYSLKDGNELTDEVIGYGNKLIDYLSALLRGRSYPSDKLFETEKKLLLRKEILSRITKIDQRIPSNHNLKGFAADLYPNLKTLLDFNTKQFLTILSNAFETFDSENSFLMNEKQRVVDILIQVMVESPGFDDKQMGALFIFIATILSNKRNTLSIKDSLMDEVLEYLFKSEEFSWFEERQQVLLELLQSDNGLVFDENKIIEMAKNANFFRICEYIYIKNRNWGQNLACYFNDKHRKSHVFDYINQILLSSNVTEEEKRDFKQFIYSKIDCLTEIDNKKSAKLILNDLDIERFEDILNSLKTNPQILYKFLFGVLFGTTSKTHKRDPSTGSISFESLSLKEQRKQTIITDQKIQEQFIELMFEFEPNFVFKALNILEDYRPDIVLVNCKKYNLNDGTAYLLEKCSQFEEAFNLLYTELDQSIKDFNESEMDKSWHRIENQMNNLIDFCRRSSPKMVGTKESQNFWLSLLDSMLTIKQLIKSSSKAHPLGENVDKDLNGLLIKLIECMKKTTDLTSIFETVINKPSLLSPSSGPTLDIWRDMFNIVYENYNYEETLLQTTNSLLLNELHQQFIRLKKDVNKANANRYKLCPVCSKALDIEDSIIFHCSHTFHEKCVTFKGKPPKCQLCDPSSDDNIENEKSSHRLSLTQEFTQNTNSDQSLRKTLKLSESQMKTLEYLRNGQRIDSRAKILNHLPNTRIKLLSNEGQTDNFKLNLAPKWRKK